MPKRSIVISGVQRSGTSLFCEGLTATGRAGRPTEYFLSLSDPEWIKGKTDDEIRQDVGLSEQGESQSKDERVPS